MTNREEASPLEAIPGLEAIARVMSDAVVVTDLHRRVVSWNDAAADLYGITAGDALGRAIDELYDTTVIGEGSTWSAARATAIDQGAWRGRIVDRPRVGRKVGHELTIEAVLDRIDAADGTPLGVLSVRRDVTATVRIERELALLGSLAGSGGITPGATAHANATLAKLAEVLGIGLAVILVPDGERPRVLASHGLHEDFLSNVSNVVWRDSPLVRAVQPVGRVVKGLVDRLPLTPAVRRSLLGGGIRTLVAVGLHQDDALTGVLALGWSTDDPAIPSDATVLLIAANVAQGQANARLVERVLSRADAERATTTRLRALDELTRVGGVADSIDDLVQRSATLINASLGAAGTGYGLLGPDGDDFSTTAIVDVQPAIAAWLASARPDQRSAFRRWRAGEGAFIEPFETGVVAQQYLDLAREAGLSAYGAIPVRVDGQVVGGIVTYFDRPPEDLQIDRGALDRVATIASISLANFRLRERLMASEASYRTLFEASPDAMLVERLDRTVMQVNDAATALYRTNAEWLVGRSASDLGSFDADVAQARAQGMEPGDSYRARSTGIRRDGERFPSDVHVTRIDLDGEPRLLVRIRDLTEQERLQAELIQAQKMEATGQLVSGVAHELNNPLAAILGFSQLIRRDANLPEDLRHNADLLVEEATRTRRIVQNLLDFARQRPPERHPTSIRALVDSVIALQSYSFGLGNIAVEVDIPDDLPLVELDRGQLQQVLVNLTHNAVYAIRSVGGGRLRIAAVSEGSAEAPRVRVTVTDDGPGVAVEDVPRVFEAFFTTKPVSDGTGLGLPVSYGIIRSHGGELVYRPGPDGVGASFTFDLPVQAIVEDGDRSSARPPRGDDVAPDLERAQPPAGSRGTVLVLDDEPSIRAFLAKAAEAVGFDAVVTATGAEAIEAAGRSDFEVYLIDHQMPDMSGIDVYAAIVGVDAARADRFILMSGDVLNATVAEFAADRGVALLSKPFDLETLEQTLRSAQARGYV